MVATKEENERYRESGKLISNISAVLIPISLGLTALIFSNLNYNFQMWIKVVVFTTVVLQCLFFAFSLFSGIGMFKGGEELKTKFGFAFYSLLIAMILTSISYLILIASVFFK